MFYKKLYIMSALFIVLFSSIAFSIEYDNEKPTIIHEQINEVSNLKDLKVSAIINSPNKLKNVVLMYRHSNEVKYKSIDMINKNNQHYYAIIPKEQLSFNSIDYYIRASDGKNVSTTIKDSIPYTFSVDLNDTESPSIKSIFPYNGQEHIIGTPTIKATFEDFSGINTNSIKLFVNYIDVTKKCTIKENMIYYTPENKFKRGNQIVQLQISDKSKQANKTVVEWYFNVGTKKYNHYYGNLHSHTGATDGKGSFEEAYIHARDVANLDFFAITEHSHLLDNHLDCDINNASHSNKWNELISASKKFSSNGKFLALYGFEMSYDFESQPKFGHINTFNTQGFESKDKDKMDLKNFYNILYKQENSFSQFNHPGDKFGDFNNFEYSEEADSAITLFEIGNGYNKDLKSDKNIRAFDKYQEALDKGWHIAPTSSQDNHRQDWGSANSFRTVVLSPSLTVNTLYDSIKNMHVYSSEDKNIKIDYSINDHIMGSIIKNPTKLDFSISVIDNDYIDKITSIEIISNNGEIIEKREFNSNLAKLDFTIPCSESKFYYLKVTQSDGGVSITAPIWIEFEE